MGEGVIFQREIFRGNMTRRRFFPAKKPERFFPLAESQRSDPALFTSHARAQSHYSVFIKTVAVPNFLQENAETAENLSVLMPLRPCSACSC